MSAEMTDEQIWDMSDEELEAAFRNAKAEGISPDLGIESDVDDEVEVDGVDNTEDEEIEVDDLEQPVEDSDDDASSDEDEEEESEDESEEDEGELDGEPKAEDDQTEEDEEESDEEEQPVQEDEVLNFKANGQEYQFTTKEMKEQFGKVFGQAMDYTKKMQQIKPWRKTIDAIEQAQLSGDDINLMIDVLKGDKDAIAAVMKRTGVDALDLDTENSNYVAKDYGRDDTELAIKDIVDEISVDKEYAITHNVLDKQWDDASRGEFVKDPNLIKLLHVDVKSGMFDKVNPIAQKLKVYDGGKQSDLDYYKMAAQQYFDNEAQNEYNAQEKTRIAAERAEKAEAERSRIEAVKAKQEQQKAVKQASSRRKAAAPTKSNAGTKKVVDYLDDSDEAFEDWYSKLQESH